MKTLREHAEGRGIPRGRIIKLFVGIDACVLVRTMKSRPAGRSGKRA